jgi:hypothetical protein
VSPLAGVAIVAAVLAVGYPAARWQIRRAARHESERDRLIRAAHDVGPDSLRLLQDTDRYLERIAAGDPELNAGLTRLRHELTHREEDQ